MSLLWSQSSNCSHLTPKESCCFYSDLEGQHDLVFLLYFSDFISDTAIFLILFQPSDLILHWGSLACSCFGDFSICSCLCLCSLFSNISHLLPCCRFLHKYYLVNETFLGYLIYNFNSYLTLPMCLLFSFLTYFTYILLIYLVFCLFVYPTRI